jgi:hypothetical protein
LYQYLKYAGGDVWLDKESLVAGQDGDLEIRKAVRTSDAVVVCLSKGFNKAGYRQKEVRLALDTAMEKLDGEIFIIPARLEECGIPDNLSKWHMVDLFGEGGRKKLTDALRARATVWEQVYADEEARKHRRVEIDSLTTILICKLILDLLSCIGRKMNLRSRTNKDQLEGLLEFGLILRMVFGATE